MHVRFMERRRDASFAAELESYLFNGSSLWECEHDMAGQQGRLNVYDRAFEYNDIGVEDDVNARLVMM